MSSSTATTPPLLSKTCQNCSQLKIRCDRTQQGPVCDRCRRLGKHCVYRPARRRYNSARHDNRIEALESRLKEFMRSCASSSHNTQHGPPETARSRYHSPVANNSPSSSTSIEASERTSGSSGDVLDAGLLTIDRADHLLGTYRSTLTPHFPFVVIPPEVTVEKLRRDKPFLFLCILSSASFHDMPLQRKLGRMVTQAISDRIVLGGDISFEVLQGLLVFLAWSQYHPRPRRYSQYLQLAVSIVSDLRLDREPMTSWQTNVGSRRDPRPTPQRWGPGEQRAVAGCFYLSSTIANLLQKLNTFPYTKYLEDCCLSLRERYEYPTDEYIYHIIQLQHIMESTGYVSLQQGDAAATSSAVLGLRSQLQSFRAHLAFELSDNHLLLMQFRTAELFLCQAVFFDRNVQPDAALHLELLCSGLSAAQSLLNFYLSLPVYAEMAFNNSEWIQISFALTTASRLAVASSADGAVDHQTRHLRQSLELSNVLRHLSLRIGALVTQQLDAQGDRDIFYHYEQRVVRIQSWFDHFSAPARKMQLEKYRGSPPVGHFPQDNSGLFQTFSQQTAASISSTSLPSSTTPMEDFQNLPTSHPYAGPALSQTGTPDVQISEVFAESALDYFYCDWLSPMNS